jgi:hypothetical protein
VVAEVEYESWAEELRLCGGEETLMRPSDILAFVMDLPSPPPLSKLGVSGDVSFGGVSMVGVLGLRMEARDSEARGLLGVTMLRRLSPRGGWGNALMLITLRSVRDDEVLRLEVGLGWAPGVGVRADSRRESRTEADEGARRPLMLLGAAMEEGVEGVWRFPVLFRVFVTGRLGRGRFGGPFDGLVEAGRGMVVAMVRISKRDFESCGPGGVNSSSGFGDGDGWRVAGGSRQAGKQASYTVKGTE